MVSRASYAAHFDLDVFAFFANATNNLIDAKPNGPERSPIARARRRAVLRLLRRAVSYSPARRFTTRLPPFGPAANTSKLT